MADQDIALVAHLMRRAGFGASRDEIEAKAAQGYDSVVQELLNPTGGLDEDILMRYNPAYHEAAAIEVNTQLWVYRMINNPQPAPGKGRPLLAHDLLRRAQQDRLRPGNGHHGRHVPGAWHGPLR